MGDNRKIERYGRLEGRILVVMEHPSRSNLSHVFLANLGYAQ